MNLKKLAGRAISTLFLSMLCLVAFAQTATGLVKDKTGEPMIGVNVLVKGTTNGTITDFDGKFTIPDVPGNATLVVSYIGYLTKEVRFSGQKELIIVLEEDNKTLDEVVVIGYGTVKKRDLTGAVASVSSKDLVANPVANVTQALQGQLPGVSVASQDGRPGAEVAIRIRGGGSITQSNDPLFVVDGFPVSSISDIPADQIESIDVLKDAASTAIYGARGANGVILVTTKNAKAERISVKYNGYIQTKSVADMLDVLDAQDYVFNQWAYATAYGSAFGNSVAEYFGLGSANGNHYADYVKIKAHDYTTDLLRTAYSHNHNLTISGGTEKTKILMSVGYINDEGIRINSGYNRWNASLKIQQEIAKNLKLNFDARYYEVGIEGKNDLDLISTAFRYRPIDEPLGTGNFEGFGIGSINVDPTQNPVNLMNDYVQGNNKYGIRAQTSVIWEVIKGLTVTTDLGLGRSWSEEKLFQYGLTTKSGKSYAKLTKGNSWNVRSATTVNWQVQGLGEDHSLSFLAGNEVLANKSNSSKMEGAGYPDSFGPEDAFGMINMTDSSLGLDAFSNTYGTPAKSISFFGRANYSYKGRYLLTATFRADGSSKFSPNNRWGYFPAAALAWRISDEAFMEGTRDWLDNLKLRVSYGTAGSDNIDSSLWKETWKTQNITVSGTPDVSYVPEGLMSNYDLKWETTVSRNMGVDFGFWNNKLHGSLDVYWNSTKDLLMKVPVDNTSGYQYQYQNVGETSNKGFELSLAWNVVRTKDFSLSINGTYNFNRNKIEELSEGITTDYRDGWGSTTMKPYNDYILKVGSPVGIVRGLLSDGFYTVDDFDVVNGSYILKAGVPDLSSDIIVNYPGSTNFNLPAGQTAFPGAMKFRDVAGDDNQITLADVVDLGEITPKHTGGFNINATYKGFDLNAGFAWQIGGHVYNANAMDSFRGDKDSRLGANNYNLVKDSYKIYNVDPSGDLYAITDPAELNRLNSSAKYGLPWVENGLVMSDWFEDASFLRLNTLTIGYTLPKSITKKFAVQNLRVYATGGNLFCLTGYSGLDPEINTRPSNSSGFPTLGIDRGAYPRARTYTFGINVEF